MNKLISVSIVIVIALIIGNIIYNEFIRKETPIPEPETKIKWIEEKYSVIEEIEKCKNWGGSFDGDFYRDTENVSFYSMRYLKMKCTKENWKGNVTETETLFDYKFLLEDIRKIPIEIQYK